MRSLRFATPWRSKRSPDWIRGRHTLRIAKLGGARHEGIGDSHKLAGFLFAGRDGGVVLVEGEGTSEARKRFTKAHELGHFILQVLPGLEDRGRTADLFELSKPPQRFFRNECTPQDLTRMNNTPRESWLHEVRANYFAAELLMPAQEIREQLQQLGRGVLRPTAHELTTTLSRYFGVSREAMAIRLADLQAIEPAAGQGHLQVD